MQSTTSNGARADSLSQKLRRAWNQLVTVLNLASPLVDLGVRLWLVNVFFTSGMTKIANWDSTLSLFENEYAVPLLPPEIAAYAGTAAELALPVFLFFGLGTRMVAIALFIFNIVAATSYPDLSPIGLKDHQVWGLLILVTIVHGPGKLSLDCWIQRKFFS